jgi:hypothetical protein
MKDKSDGFDGINRRDSLASAALAVHAPVRSAAALTPTA